MIPVDDSYVQHELNVRHSPGGLASRLAYAAFALWLLSLPLVGIARYAVEGGMRGYEILLTGWLSPLVLNFAWYANVFFLYAFVQIIKGRLATKSALLACILSIDTFRYADIPSLGGGGGDMVYGYGWGAILWFLAMSVILIAAGIRFRESHSEASGKFSVGMLLKPVGILTLLIVICASLGWAAYDHIKANTHERKKLAGLAFKRHSVCSIPEPQVKSATKTFSGVLEFVPPSNDAHGYSISDINVKTLLDWGVPVVRAFGYDYTLFSSGERVLMTSSPASGEPSAILTVNERKGKFSEIDITLYDYSKKQLVFDGKWHEEIQNSRQFCPSYQPFSNSASPRKLLTMALGLTDRPGETGSAFDANLHEVKTRQIGDLYSGVALNDLLKNKSVAEYTKIYRDINYLNCKDKLNFSDQVGAPRSRFQIGEKSYYEVPGDKAVCVNDDIYLYGFARRNESVVLLYIYRRSFPDFQQIWKRTLLIEGALASVSVNDLRVIQIDDNSEAFLIDVIDDASGKVGRFEAVLE